MKKTIWLFIFLLLISSMSSFINHANAYNYFGGRIPSNMGGVGLQDYICGFYYKYDNNISGIIKNITFWSYMVSGHFYHCKCVIYGSDRLLIGYSENNTKSVPFSNYFAITINFTNPVFLYPNKYYWVCVWSNLSAGGGFSLLDSGTGSTLLHYMDYTFTSHGGIPPYVFANYSIDETDSGYMLVSYYINTTLHLTDIKMNCSGSTTFFQNSAGIWINSTHIGGVLSMISSTIILDTGQIGIIILMALTIFFLVMGYGIQDRKQGAYFLMFGGIFFLSLMMSLLATFSGVWWFTSPAFILFSIIIFRDSILLLWSGKKYRR